jgi:hypothetical protein
VDVAFEVVDGDEGQALREGKSLGVGDANQQCAGETGSGGHGDGVKAGEGDASLCECGAYDGDDGAEMLAAGQLWDDSAVAGVGGDLGGDNRGENAGAAFDDGGGGLVAGGFDAEDEAALAHPFSLAAGMVEHRCAFVLSQVSKSRPGAPSRGCREREWKRCHR